MHLDEMQRLYLRDGKLYTVTNEPGVSDEDCSLLVPSVLARSPRITDLRPKPAADPTQLSAARSTP